MSISPDSSTDVLGTDPPEVTSRPSRALTVAVCLVAVLAAAVVALLQRGDRAAATPTEVVGTMFLEDVSSRLVELPFADEQHRDGFAHGRVQLELPDRQLRGDARLVFGASVELVDGGPAVIHAWGDVRLRFDDSTCLGWFGWSNFVEPLEGGGSMHVRCDDGATITGRLAATAQPQAVGVVIDVEDGTYVAGG